MILRFLVLRTNPRLDFVVGAEPLQIGLGIFVTDRLVGKEAQRLVFLNRPIKSSKLEHMKLLKKQ